MESRFSWSRLGEGSLALLAVDIWVRHCGREPCECEFGRRILPYQL